MSTHPLDRIRAAIGEDHYRAQPYRVSWARVAVLSALALALAAAVASTAFAQEGINRPPVCGTPAEMAAALEPYGERQHGTGITSNGTVLVLWLDPADGSWTLTERSPSNPAASCVVKAGEGWHERKPAAQGAPA
jgi:hypothetical protein